MNKFVFTLIALVVSVSAEAKCLKGQFEIPLANHRYNVGNQSVSVEEGKARVEFDLKIADDGDSAQFVSKVLNGSDPVVIKEQKSVSVAQLVTADNLILAREAVRGPRLVFQSDDRNVRIEFAMMSENKIKTVGYFGSEPLKVQTVLVSESCQ